MSGQLDMKEPSFVAAGLTEGITIPPILEESVRRHQANLARLATNLQSAGLSLVQVEESINVLVETYRAELMSAVRAIMDRDNV